MINPGAFGANGNQVFLNIRSGWTGFPGAPITYAISGSGTVGQCAYCWRQHYGGKCGRIDQPTISRGIGWTIQNHR
ncbi:MAG: hypothetical protein HC912_01455 [Saprospiraceae bacterium]|nr:hypothetical protein [Saprospiraceae bacterium]